MLFNNESNIIYLYDITLHISSLFIMLTIIWCIPHIFLCSCFPFWLWSLLKYNNCSKRIYYSIKIQHKILWNMLHMNIYIWSWGYCAAKCCIHCLLWSTGIISCWRFLVRRLKCSWLLCCSKTAIDWRIWSTSNLCCPLWTLFCKRIVIF